MATSLKYLEDSELYNSSGTVVKVDAPEFGGDAILITDQTIFYPQGGGQPTDRGTITCGDAKQEITKVSFNDGEVWHIGPILAGSFQVGDTVDFSIDPELRKNHARLHTGGHLVMTAVDRLLGLPSIKGYHFPDGPYVEFEGSVAAENREKVLNSIQDLLVELVAEDSEVTARFESIENLRALGIHIPSEIPANKPTRVVTTSGYQSPCGGTHVKRLGQLQGLFARGLKSKSGKVRVSYNFA